MVSSGLGISSLYLRQDRHANLHPSGCQSPLIPALSLEISFRSESHSEQDPGISMNEVDTLRGSLKTSTSKRGLQCRSADAVDKLDNHVDVRNLGTQR